VGLGPGPDVAHHRGHLLEVPLRRLKVTGDDSSFPMALSGAGTF
jgi:hypothetical protein